MLFSVRSVAVEVFSSRKNNEETSICNICNDGQKGKKGHRHLLDENISCNRQKQSTRKKKNITSEKQTK